MLEFSYILGFPKRALYIYICICICNYVYVCVYVYIYIYADMIIHIMLEGPNHTIHTKPFRETKGISAAGGKTHQWHFDILIGLEVFVYSQKSNPQPKPPATHLGSSIQHGSPRWSFILKRNAFPSNLHIVPLLRNSPKLYQPKELEVGKRVWPLGGE